MESEEQIPKLESRGKDRLPDLIWNLIPLFAAWGACAMRFCNPPVPGVLSSYGFDFGLASIFGFALGRHIHRVRVLGKSRRLSFGAAIGVGIAATVFEFLFPYNTFDPLDILAYWAGIIYAIAGLWFVGRLGHDGNSK